MWPWQSDDPRMYDSLEFRECLRSFSQLPAITTFSAGGAMEYQISRLQAAAGTSRMRNLHLHHLDVSTNLMTMTQIP